MKKFLKTAIATIFLASMALTGCGGGTTPASTTAKSTTTDTTKVTSTGYSQAPSLDGKGLPPVKDRLPVQPKLVNEEPSDLLNYTIGTYGGTLRTVTSTPNWDADVFVMDNEPLLNTPGILGSQITGNILQGYKVSPDQKTFTFTMRKGLKWSDGQPVTVQDVKFAFDDVLFNKELTPVFPAWLRSGGKVDGQPLKFDVINDYTFQISFSEPYGGFPILLSIKGWVGYTDLLKPFHFLKQYHKKYADPVVLAQEIKKAGFKKGDWVKLFQTKDVLNWDLPNPKAIGFPVLYPWMLVKKTATTEYFDRNPYYFKVDSAGNQLPYIDNIQSSMVQSMDMEVMSVLAGNVDFQRQDAALNKMPLYKENESHGYKAIMSKLHVTPTDIFLNETYKDPVWRKVVQDVRFRQALSLAMNRKDIINDIYYGFADPGIIENPAFNLDEANKLLDDMGMKKGPDGYRVGPDGKKFVIPFEVAAIAPDVVPLTELVMAQWRSLGLDVTMKTIDPTLWGTRNAANQLRATVGWVHTQLWYMGDWGQGYWGPLWNEWYTTGGKQGEKPPADVEKLYNLINQVSVSSPDEAQKAIEQVHQELGKNLWFFVPIENVKQPVIVNAKLGNVTDKGYAIGLNFSAEELYYKK